ncbi:hypothetical protein HPB49_008531 [Dermacentor silvarum]|uniref:Uncharacterized protein n=1 Tax=Dermacentor silvarum TaxID=543639 RepID=A0ACB8DC24_DERSI|nr:hypothetical protein HPB49_008531 [Dermacentor silvarum]
MQVTALRGYDPTTLAWKNVPASTPEDSVPPTDIVDEGLFTVMTLRKRRQQSNTAKASDTDKAKSAKTPPKKKTSRVSWRPASMPRTAAEDFTVVLKPRVTVDLKAAFQPGELGAKLASYSNATNSDCISVWPIWAQNIIVVSTNDINTANLLSREFSLKTSQGPLPMIGHAKISGEVCRGVITVHEQETSASLKAKIHWRSGNIAFIRKLGKTSVALLTLEGHHVPRFVHYNSVVTPVREYKRTIPACYCCGTVGHRPELCPNPNDQRCDYCGQVEHLTGSPACKAKFRRLQQTGGQHGGRVSPQQRPKPKTSDVTPEGRQPGATNQTPKTNQQVPHPPKTSQASQKTSSKTADQGAPVFQAGEFPPLTSGAAPRQPAKKTSSQWNCRGFKDRAKRANFSLYLETFEHLCAVVALQEPGNAVRLTGYNTFQWDPFTCLLVHKTLTAQEVDLDLSIPYSYTMVTILPLRRADPPVHILYIYCRPKLKRSLSLTPSPGR